MAWKVVYHFKMAHFKRLAEFLETYKPAFCKKKKKNSLWKFAVIWLKRRQKTGFLSPISSKITLMKEKQRRERDSEEEERRRREKSNGCILSFYKGYFYRRKSNPGPLTCKATAFPIATTPKTNIPPNMHVINNYSSSPNGLWVLGLMGYWLRGHEGGRNNCFSKIQLVGQKYRE